MLGKLIKHELRASRRMMLPFILAELAAALMFGISMNIVGRGISTPEWLDWIFMLSSILFVVGLIALSAMAYVVMVERFRRNLLGDEGYLMFTLPVTVDQHIFSKMIAASIWFIVTALVFIGSVFIMLAVNVDFFALDWSEFSQAVMATWLRALDMVGLGHMLGFALEFIVMMILGIFSACLMFYLAMAIGYSFSDHKLLISVVAFFGVSFVLNLLGALFMFTISSADIYGSIEDPWWPGHIAFLMLIAQALLQCVVFYLPTRLLLKKRLNLP